MTMAGVIDDSAADESLREVMDIFEQDIIQHLHEPSRLFPHMDVSLIPLGKLRLYYVCAIHITACRPNTFETDRNMFKVHYKVLKLNIC